MHATTHTATPSQQSDAAKLRWLRQRPDERRQATEAAREGRREKLRQQLPPGLDPDEQERRIDELIAIHMRRISRRRNALQRQADALDAEAEQLGVTNG